MRSVPCPAESFLGMRAGHATIATVPLMEPPSLWERLRRVNPYFWDGVLAVAVLGASVLLEVLFLHPAGQEATGGGGPRFDWWLRLLLAAACAPLVWRRKAPIVALAGTAIGLVALRLWGYPIDFAGIALVIAEYSAAAHRGRVPVLTLALPVAIGAWVAIFLIERPVHRDWAELVVDVGASVALPMLFGRYEFNRRRRSERDSQRAAHDAVAEERARIAHELHDVVAHAMSVMVVQAGAARVIIRRDPEEATAALKRIEDTGRMGLGEMRRLLGIEESVDKGTPLMPQPGLDRLDELLDNIRGTGLPVEAMVEGTPCHLSPGVDLTAYRVVQEGLTNALKHAGEAHARVLLRYGEEALEVEIADDGRGPPPDGTEPAGHGLIGMRERVALFGGSLETGARPGGGFIVRARIPVAGPT